MQAVVSHEMRTIVAIIMQLLEKLTQSLLYCKFSDESKNSNYENPNALVKDISLQTNLLNSFLHDLLDIA